MNPRRVGAWVLAGLLGVAVFADRLPPDWGYRGLVTIRGELGPWPLEPLEDVESLPSATREGTLSAPLTGGRTLVVRNEVGSVRLQGTGEPVASLRYRVTVYARTAEAAEAYLAQVQVGLESDPAGDRLVLSTARPAAPAAVRRVQVDIDGAVPEGARVDVANAYGTVELRGVGGPSKVANRFGRTALEQVQGDWEVETGYGALEARGVAGSLQVRGDFGRHDIQDVAGDVAVQAAFGDVNIESLRRAADVRIRYGNATIRLAPPLDHRFDVEARFGSVSARGQPLREAGTRVSEGPTQRWTALTGQGRYRVEVRAEFGNVLVATGP